MPSPEPRSAGPGLLYRRLALQLAGAIETGSLQVGDRAPSVRALARQHGVSLATAVQALRLLEAQRILEARPRSGYFVARRPRQAPEPAASQPPRGARYVVWPSLLREYIEALASPGVLRLGALVPAASMFPSERIARLLAAFTRSSPDVAVAHHTYSSGAPPLRRAIARRAVECGVQLAPEDVVITGGALEAVSLALRAVARAGAVVALESPSYFPLLQSIESLGMKALEIPTHPRHGMSIDALDLATQRTGAVDAVLLVPTHSNPSGSTLPAEQRRRLVELCAARGIPVIEDDVYGDVSFEAPRPRPLKAWDREGNVLWCSSFGKSVAPALRVGWIAAGRHQREVELLKLAHTMFTAQVPQFALAEFIASGGYDRHLRRLRETLRSNYERMRDAVEANFPPGTRLSRPAGGYVLWVEVPGLDATELFRRARDERVVVAPGPLFTSTPRFRECLRLSYSHPWSAEIEAGIATVGRLAREETSG